jgi:hypothetical protein
MYFGYVGIVGLTGSCTKDVDNHKDLQTSSKDLAPLLLAGVSSPATMVSHFPWSHGLIPIKEKKRKENVKTKFELSIASSQSSSEELAMYPT